MTIGTVGLTGQTPWRRRGVGSRSRRAGRAGGGGAGPAAVPLRVRGGAAVREVGIEFGALPAAEMMVHDQALAERCVDRHGEPAAQLGEADQPQVGVQDLRLVDDQHRQRPGFLDLAGDLRPDGTAGGGAGAFGRQVEFPGDRLVPVHDVAGDHRDVEHPVQAEMPHRPGRMLGLDQQLGGLRQPLRLAAVGARLGVPDIEAAGALAMQPVAHGPAATRVRSVPGMRQAASSARQPARCCGSKPITTSSACRTKRTRRRSQRMAPGSAMWSWRTWSAACIRLAACSACTTIVSSSRSVPAAAPPSSRQQAEGGVDRGQYQPSSGRSGCDRRRRHLGHRSPSPVAFDADEMEAAA